MGKKQEKKPVTEKTIFEAHLKLVLVTIALPMGLTLIAFILMQLFVTFEGLMRTPFFPESGLVLNIFFLSPFGFMLLLSILGTLVASIVMIRAGVIQKRKIEEELQDAKSRARERQFRASDAGQSGYYSVSNGLLLIGGGNDKVPSMADVASEAAALQARFLPNASSIDSIGDIAPKATVTVRRKPQFPTLNNRDYGDDMGCVG